MSFSDHAAALLARDDLGHRGVVARRAGRAVGRGVVEHETSVSYGSARRSRGDRVEAAQQQLALLGVDHAEGDLDGHGPEASDRLYGLPVRVHVVDPSAYTPPYDHAPVRRARRGGGGRRARHEPLRLRRRRPLAGATPCARPSTAWRRGAPGSRRRLARQARRSTSRTCSLPRRGAGAPTSCTSSGSPPSRSTSACCRAASRAVLTAHDVLPREPRPGSVPAQRRALRPHGRGRRALRARPRAGCSTAWGCRPSASGSSRTAPWTP